MIILPVKELLLVSVAVGFALCCFAEIPAPAVSKSDAVTRAAVTYAPFGLRQRVELPASSTGTGAHDFYSLFAAWPFSGETVYGIGIAADKKFFYKDAIVTVEGREQVRVALRQELPAGFGRKVNYLGVTFASQFVPACPANWSRRSRAQEEAMATAGSSTDRTKVS